MLLLWRRLVLLRRRSLMLVLWDCLVLLLRCELAMSLLRGSDSARLIAVRLILGCVILVRLILIGLAVHRLHGLRRLTWILMHLHGIVLLRFGLIVCLDGRRRVDVAIGSERLADNQTGRTAMVYVGELSLIGAGYVFIL